MSGKGCCWDNAMVENFYSTLKLELNLCDNREEPISPHTLQPDLAFWIEGYYYRERYHSTIGCLSPIGYEQRFGGCPTLTHVNADRCPRNWGNPRPSTPPARQSRP
jgi:putative transposase